MAHYDEDFERQHIKDERKAMTNTLTISREQLEILLSGPPGEGYLAAKKELRALLAAPVVKGSNKCGRCGASTVEGCNYLGCYFLESGNGAPVVERQEPFAYSFRFAGCVTAAGPDSWRDELDKEKPAQFLFDDGRVKNFQPLYTSTPTPTPWSYCPECGCEELQHEQGRHKQCANCHQEWFSDIDYSEVVRGNLAKLKSSPPTSVVMVLDESVEFEKWWHRTPILRKGKLQIAQEAWQARACLGKIEELNQSYYILKTEEFEQMSKAIKENPMIKNRALQDLINRKPGWS